MPLTIISENINQDPNQNEKDMTVQFVGEKFSFINYMSGTITMAATFYQASAEEKEKELLRIIKKELFPEPFNQDKIELLETKLNLVKSESLSLITEAKHLTINGLNDINEIVSKISKQVLKSEITAEDYQELISIYPEWKTETLYEKGTLVRYDLKAWEVIQEHTSQADWTPETVPALFKEITPKTTTDPATGDPVEIVPDFIQPTGGHDAYKLGDKVAFEGKVYKSIIEANTYSPKDYAAGWEEVIA